MTTPFIGEIKIFGFSFNPRGYAMCNGQLLAINTNQALFAILGTTYGGNGTTNFALPDMRGRAPIHRGTGAGLTTFTQGQQSGTESVTVLTTQLAQHTHAFMASTAPATGRIVNGGTFADDAVSDVNYMAPFNAAGSNYVALSASSLALQGGSQPHPNMQPFAVTNVCIALQGLFPSRN